MAIGWQSYLSFLNRAVEGGVEREEKEEKEEKEKEERERDATGKEAAV